MGVISTQKPGSAKELSDRCGSTMYQVSGGKGRGEGREGRAGGGEGGGVCRVSVDLIGVALL